MAAPTEPSSIDGAPLTDEQRAWLREMIAIVYGVDPVREATAIVAQAVAAFRKVHRRVGRSWSMRAIIRLGRDEEGPEVAVGVTPPM